MKEREPLNFASTTRAPPVGRRCAILGGGIFNRNYGEFSTGVDTRRLAQGWRPEDLLSASESCDGEHFTSPVTAVELGTCNGPVFDDCSDATVRRIFARSSSKPLFFQPPSVSAGMLLCWL